MTDMSGPQNICERFRMRPFFISAHFVWEGLAHENCIFTFIFQGEMKAETWQAPNVLNSFFKTTLFLLLNFLRSNPSASPNAQSPVDSLSK